MPWHWSAIPGHLLCLTSCHADHPSLSKENSLCCPARHILTNLAWDLGENPKSLGDNISLPHTKYLRSLRASSDLARREEREVGFPGWISELIPGGKNPLMLANFAQTRLQQTLPQGSSVFPSCVSRLRSDAIFECEWRALVGWKRSWITSEQQLQQLAGSLQSCSRVRRGKWTQRPALGTAEVIVVGEMAAAISQGELGS